MTEQNDVGRFSRKRSFKDYRTLEEEQQPRTKRSRTSFTTHQLQRLLIYFAQDSYPDQMKQQNIAEELDLTRLNVYNWFQNRRAKERKQAANMCSPSYAGFYIHAVPAQSNLTPPLARMAAATNNPSTSVQTNSCMRFHQASQPYQRVAASTPSSIPSTPFNAAIPAASLKPIAQPQFISQYSYSNSTKPQDRLPSAAALSSQPILHFPRAGSMEPTASTSIRHNLAVAPSTIYSPSPASSPIPITPPYCTSPIDNGCHYDPYLTNDEGAIITSRSSCIYIGEENTSEGPPLLQYYPHVQLPPFSMVFPPRSTQ